MNIAWATDIHLDFLNKLPKRKINFFRELQRTKADAVLLTGDIGSAMTVERHLQDMAEFLKIPIYFVLGNHDFYHGSVKQVRKDIRAMCMDNPYLIYLPDEGPIAISDTCCLVGADGWGDGGNGDRDNFVYLNDYDLIAEYFAVHRGAGFGRRELILKEMKKQGKHEAAVAYDQLELAFENFTDIIFATHVPPFVEAAWHEGEHSEPVWQCGFTCKAVGDLLHYQMATHPEHKMLVVCGHTHGEGMSEVLPNLITMTGSAQYGRPRVESVLEYE